MSRISNESLLALIEDHDIQLNPIGILIELGRRKGFVTLDDVLSHFPEAEEDISQLEEAFAALIGAGVPFTEDISERPDADEAAGNQNGRLQAGANGGAIGGANGSASLDNIDIHDTIGLYLKEAARVPLLNAQEEVELSQRVERGRLAREELARGNSTPRRARALCRLIEDGWEAREHLIIANSRLVISVAKKYIGRGVPFLDLIQEGNIGLMRAAKKFDYRRGFKFSTYATWWIRQAVTRAIADQGRTIRVPVHMGDQINKMLRAQHQLKQLLSRDPTTDELAAHLEVTSQKVESMIQASRHPFSLQTPVGEEDEEALGDFIEDQDTPPPDDSAADNILRERIWEVLSELPAREARILQLRYGLIDGQAHTLKEVGRKMGVTRERVRQIEAQALRRLRTPQLQNTLHGYLE